MSNFTFNFIGWVKDNHSDKVWVSMSCGDQHYCAWGKRGAKLQFKQHSRQSLRGVENQKRHRYKEVDEFQLFAIFPDFKNEAEKQLLIKILSGDYR